MAKKNSIRKVKGGAFPIYKQLFESPAFRSLDPPARALLLEFRARYWQGNRETINISVREAVKLINCGDKTVTKAFKQLEEKGFIELLEPHIYSQGKARVYRLTFEKYNNRSATDEWKCLN